METIGIELKSFPRVKLSISVSVSEGELQLYKYAFISNIKFISAA